MAAEEKESTGSSGKWVGAVVLGVVAVVFMFLFRTEIGRFLGLVSTVSFDTPLGTLEVTADPVEAEVPQPSIDQNTYADPLNGFQISWPSGWTGDTDSVRSQIADQLGIDPTVLPIVIYEGTVLESSGANVNVVIENLPGELAASEYLQAGIAQLQDLGVSVESSDSDEETESGFLSGRHTLFTERDTLYFQRFQLRGGRAYVVTATGFPPIDALSVEIQEELLEIFNSFRLVE